MDSLLELSARNERRARDIIASLDIVGLWASIGAEANLIGSVRTGLVMKHRDIDFHIYSAPLDVAASFSAMARLAANPAVTRLEFTNQMDTEEQCVEWHAWYRDADGEVWQIDMIYILRGSKYDGHMEWVADRLLRVMTPEQRKTILRLKYDTPDDTAIPGIEYYRAVLQDGVSTYAEFARWRERNPMNGVVEWVP